MRHSLHRAPRHNRRVAGLPRLWQTVPHAGPRRLCGTDRGSEGHRSHRDAGICGHLDDGRVRVLYSYPYGVGAYVPQGAIEWHLLFGGVQRVVANTRRRARDAELLLDRLC